MTDTATSEAPERGDELAGRLFLAGIGALELLTVEVGTRLGLYRALHTDGPLTAAELAGAAGIDERYSREWLEQQAVAALVDVDDATLPANRRRYALPDDCADVLLDPESLRFSASLTGFVVSFAGIIDDLCSAFRSGGGVSFSQYGRALRDSQAAFNRPLFTRVLTEEWLPSALPALHEHLTTSPSSRIADLGCGVGWSTLALARAYPSCHLDGVDSDAASIDEASKQAAEQGLADRITFRLHDAADALPSDAYDAVFILEALHDMARPVAALAAAKDMLKDGGVCIVMDEKVADEFTAPGDEVERFMFAASVLHCLPVGMAEQPSAGTGTMIRRSIVERYSSEAGFASLTELPVEHDFFRLYLLEP